MVPELSADRIDAIVNSVNRTLANVSVAAPVQLRPGQIWRARWDDVLEFVFVDAILDGTRNLVRVAPVKMGTEDADDSAIIVPDSSNALSIPFSIWPSLVTEIAELVLDRWVTALDSFDSLLAIKEAADHGELRHGVPILNGSSPRNRELMLLELAMEVLSAAADVPGGTGKLEVLLAGVTTATVSSVLDVEPRVALQILRGEFLIDRQQAEKLATALHRDPQELLDANPAAPDDLVGTMTALDRGASVRALAKKLQVDDSHAFANALRGSYALAARGEGKQRNWSGRADLYFEVALRS